MPKTVVTLPSKEAILKAMEVSKTSIDAAKYLAKEYETRLVAAGMQEEGAELSQIVKSFAMNVRFSLERAGSSAWFGREGASTDYQNMHANIAANALQTLKTVYTKDTPEIVLHCAVGPETEYVRGLTYVGS